ncbi:hypothetical protein COU58_02275 [Candidatus Pacearchaeota archaeon CG10_big_fil_rev_8_21_14_0_10_32_42]|nr:MAG: hypothetical protein COU58_02275 [Candidatus Pacearchaeota archaeon CG10_big_fil_rev_8_21_14_0_10_32_42]
MKIKKKTFYKSLIVLVVFVGTLFLINLLTNGSRNNDLSIFEDSSLFPSLGSNSENIVIEFSDFQCPWCTIASGIPNWTKEMAETNSNVASALGVSNKAKEMAESEKIKFIYVPMSFLGEESVNAAEASLCAKEQEKFWQMHDAIFAASTGPEENVGRYSKGNLKIIAQGVSGLDRSQFAKCLDNSEMRSKVNEITNTANKFATSTPTFFVNGKKIGASELKDELNLIA